MLGSFAVGKTSLVQRFVYSIFSDDYLSTVGVKVSKRIVNLEDTVVNMMLWDLEGRDEYGDVNVSYLRGSAGFILVADGTRKNSLQAALDLRDIAWQAIPEAPYVLLLNKYDLKEQWEIKDSDIAALQNEGMPVLLTSAKNGFNVEEAFSCLARKLANKNQD